ncbi:CRISPR-associated helicase/endonuclease Cas3 [Hydrogenivirga sp. 128-5-R1-1]|uniref:CRISPR-associated helicase/endonuclease Cas3 n=1 Tax=Hydrogenivirga sp. 128-5-R1-1 TaxID=392423 RepID=UPI00015F18AD|nr:CRISPR-associated helicase/endonuclease Cas3 [Hydrogenivirga sp. 128-5-R1-1]EDP75372.1 predicted helicase [Hydrogenivirga sp. 128-5-R1-1]
MQAKSELYSHPSVFIEDHINRCLELMNFYMEEVPLLDNETKTTIAVSTALHDFGKCTSYFQEYMRALMEGVRPKTDRLKEHAFLSGVYTFYSLKELVDDPHLFLFSFVACKRHHTNPYSFTEETSIIDEDLEFLKKQIESIDEGKANIFLSNLNLPEPVKDAVYFKKREFLDNLPDVLGEIKRLKRDVRKCKTEIKDFVKFQYIFSLILDSDKTEAGAKPFRPERVEKIPPKAVVSFKEKNLKEDSPINRLREEAFREVLEHKIDTSQRLYSITLPTGMGKTLTGFAFALKLRKTIVKETGTVPRIIYSLPFLSIIDQNAEVLERVLEEEFKEVSGRLLLKHHHLSQAGDFGEFEFSVSRVLTEGWNSEVVITTFVQFFEALISCRNSTSRRFNKLANSIVILDEVQSLPTKYWHLLREMIKEVSESLGTYFIFMTATQPYLVEECVELASKERYLKDLDRITAHFDLEEKTIDEFLDGIEFRKDKTYLFIANTIASSKELYEKLRERLEEDICYLSTSVVPYERKERIGRIKKGDYRVVVSTQLVEAGVDIDFDVVYRDFAPLDSLNQSAGRCNRNMARGRGEFRVVRLVDEKGHPFTKGVYDAVLLHITQTLLEDIDSLSEKDFTLLIEDYFKKVWEGMSKDKSEEILEAVKCFRFTGQDVSIRNFRLIDDQPYKRDVFIQLNEEAVEVWERAKTVLKDLRAKKLNVFQAKEEFEKLKSDFYKFVVSVNVRDNQPLLDSDLNMFLVNTEELDRYYDPGTGFISAGGSFIGI